MPVAEPRRRRTPAVAQVCCRCKDMTKRTQRWNGCGMDLGRATELSWGDTRSDWPRGRLAQVIRQHVPTAGGACWDAQLQGEDPRCSPGLAGDVRRQHGCADAARGRRCGTRRRVGIGRTQQTQTHKTVRQGGRRVYSEPREQGFTCGDVYREPCASGRAVSSFAWASWACSVRRRARLEARKICVNW